VLQERKRERKREKTERKQSFVLLFFEKKNEIPPKNKNKK
jgi:hypothetical protein